MKSADLGAIILAAGKGTRMKSKHPKVLHPIAGQPMAAYPLELTRVLECSKTVMVVGHEANLVKDSFCDSHIDFVHQHEQLGTGHAVQVAWKELENFSGTILLLCADVPLLRRETLEKLLHVHRSSGATVSVLSAEIEQPYGYGRIVRDDAHISSIVEEKDASAEQKKIREINTGIFALQAPHVVTLLKQLDNNNAQHEFYITDIVELAAKQGLRVSSAILDDINESMGVNDRSQLAAASALMRRRINQAHMLAGVSLEDPESTYIDATVRIDADTYIQAGVHLHGTTYIEADCVIETGSVISDSHIGTRSHIRASSCIEGSSVGEQCTIGPMAHLRPGTHLHGLNKIGNFVETKKAQIGMRSQASHLSYIGDAELGQNVNIGCGTITCNYDGVNKYKTIIEDDVFVGSDTQFIAPVTIGRNSLVGAGSTITKDVPPDSLALSRVEQKIIPGWRKKKKS
ncbi:MAG: bifunctional UDP-N-acetylglucosamine diphosphorylase/glucosamine-1-phosphate N-acetyltransferase GlmU [Desulfuromonadaceae bacterium]|nr:bifunctional UDP-N-acetylglucosamine diphosphorylase/glucosamine-1-phosphate N-acetyltransferase GlmU [Desulfuromonadaceae bacterium]